MPTPEEIKIHLERFENLRAAEELESRMEGLPNELFLIASAFLESFRTRRDHTTEGLRRQKKYAIDGLGAEGRGRLFEVLFPGLAEHVEASWQLQMALPYQVGYLRKAFRAPRHPEITLRSRVEWLDLLFFTTMRYRGGLDFLTVWAAYLGYGAEEGVGLLLAGVLDSDAPERDQTFSTLVQILNGEHEFATPSRYALRALLSSSNPEGWAVVERLLLAAQRQEGLRQVVLEAIDLAQREAFVRMLRLIGQEKLSRFAAVARAVGVWFGLPMDSAQTRWIDGMIVETLDNLEHAGRLAERLRSAKGEDLYLALWAQALDDAVVATEVAAAIAKEADFERRYPAVHLLRQLGTLGASRALRDSMSDPDLRVAVKAAEVIPSYSQWDVEVFDAEETFSALAGLIPRVPRDQKLEPAIWEWNRIHAVQAELAAKLIAHRGNRPASDMREYLPALDANGRRLNLRSIEAQVAKRKSLHTEERELALAHLGDTSNAVREYAFKILDHATLTPEEAQWMEPLLARKASDLRRGVIRLLLKQGVADCRASIERLVNSTDVSMRQAGEEIRSELEPKSVAAASLDDGLGLFDPDKRTQVVAPQRLLREKISTPAGKQLLCSLDALVGEHQETRVVYKNYNGDATEGLFGNLRWSDPDSQYPLGAVWADWWQAQRKLGAADETDLANAVCMAILMPESRAPEWVKAASNEILDGVELKYPDLVRSTSWFVLASFCTAQAVAVLLDVLETYLNRIEALFDPKAVQTHFYLSSWRPTALSLLLRMVESCRERQVDVWDSAHWQRYWRLLRWVDEGMPSEHRERPRLAITLAAHQAGAATEADLYEQLLGGRGDRGFGRYEFSMVTKRKPNQLVQSYPVLVEIVHKCRERILDVELKRGDLPTPASGPALRLSSVYGAELVLRLLQLLGKEPMSRGYLADSESKAVVFSHLIRVCLPASYDTPESFAECARRSGVARKRLVDLALYAPQWAAHVECATGIDSLEDAAYWLHAHTKDSQWSVEVEIRGLWSAAISERTPIPHQELLEGAVDVDWFHRIRKPLSDQDWKLLFDSAKFASGGGGHKRAQLFAAALGGEVGRSELAALVSTKRNQDAVRAIGLAPLPQGAEARRLEILERYELLQKFLRQSKEFGALRQASEKLAYTIGLENLARTAGYPDPQRLSWAMEAVAIADLKAGPVTVVEGDTRAVLSVNAAGEPELRFEKAGRTLKDLPAVLRKSPEMAGLRARKALLGQQTARMRQSLEEAMVRGDHFTAEELAELSEHPLLRPMVGALLFVLEGGNVCWFEDLRGEQGTVRIAHPVDLLASGQWPARQKECLEAERKQPFKQAFRELYLLTRAERETQKHSARYEGNQVHLRQAMALLGKRGWVFVPDEGLRKTFHAEKLSVWVSFLEGWLTPVETDGSTVEQVVFRSKGDGKVLALEQVNLRVFSEAMRDLDLMVSVAHRGGVDPEATASTVEMRAALLRETLLLLKIHNVRLKEQYAFVDGKIGKYNVHLGSGTVHRQPGGSLCIVPIHSQHRGRLFLPFADPDPKTAEIVSKVILLAQDDKIQDPTILEQLR